MTILLYLPTRERTLYKLDSQACVHSKMHVAPILSVNTAEIRSKSINGKNLSLSHAACTPCVPQLERMDDRQSYVMLISLCCIKNVIVYADNAVAAVYMPAHRF